MFYCSPIPTPPKNQVPRDDYQKTRARRAMFSFVKPPNTAATVEFGVLENSYRHDGYCSDGEYDDDEDLVGTIHLSQHDLYELCKHGYFVKDGDDVGFTNNWLDHYFGNELAFCDDSGAGQCGGWRYTYSSPQWVGNAPKYADVFRTHRIKLQRRNAKLTRKKRRGMYKYW